MSDDMGTIEVSQTTTRKETTVAGLEMRVVDQARRIADLEALLLSYKQLLVRIRGELAGITEDLK